MIARMRQRDRVLACYDRRKTFPAVPIAKFWGEMHPIIFAISTTRAKRISASDREAIALAHSIHDESSRRIKCGIKMNERKREVLAGKELARMKAIALEELGYIPTRKDK